MQNWQGNNPAAEIPLEDPVSMPLAASSAKNFYKVPLREQVDCIAF